MSVTVYDFTGIYENESFNFYKKEGTRSLFNGEEEAFYVSLKDISGTNCICDDFACEEIKKRIGALNLGRRAQYAEGSVTSDITKATGKGVRISFFDNGNYHYMSKLLMDELCEELSEALPLNESPDMKKAGEGLKNDSPDMNKAGAGLKAEVQADGKAGLFDLVVFDHHPDMKWTSYGEVLSCGSWVLNALKDRTELNQVFIIGADKKLMEEAYSDNPEIASRVFYFEDFAAFRKSRVSNDRDYAGKLYISVDKDVLSEDELKTNWDQGEMTVAGLMEGLSYLKVFYGDNIIAVDVCGECTPDDPKAFSPLGFEGSNSLNSSILSIFY